MGLLSRSLFTHLIAPYKQDGYVIVKAAFRNQESLRFHCDISSHNVTKYHKMSHFFNLSR